MYVQYESYSAEEILVNCRFALKIFIIEKYRLDTNKR